jgi:hypothetical protein
MTDPTDPTQVYRPMDPAGPPTQAMPPVGGDLIPPGNGPYGPPPDSAPPGPPGGGTNPAVVALLALIAVLGVAIVVLLIVNHKGSSSSGVTSTTGATATTATSTTVPPTTVAAPLPPLPTTASTTTSTPPTTSTPSTTAGAAAGHRAPTAAEDQQIRSVSNLGPNAEIDQIQIANSDPAWALEHARAAAGHENDFQAAYRILHQTGGTWTVVSGGTAAVQCGNGVPPNVAADFADILGTCPPGD